MLKIIEDKMDPALPPLKTSLIVRPEPPEYKVSQFQPWKGIQKDTMIDGIKNVWEVQEN